MSTVTRWISEFTAQSASEILTFQFPTRDIDAAGGVDRYSGVFVSVSEVAAPARGLADYPAVGTSCLGVRNVAPADDGTVQLWLVTTPPFAAPTTVRIQFLVSND